MFNIEFKDKIMNSIEKVELFKEEAISVNTSIMNDDYFILHIEFY